MFMTNDSLKDNIHTMNEKEIDEFLKGVFNHPINTPILENMISSPLDFKKRVVNRLVVNDIDHFMPLIPINRQIGSNEAYSRFNYVMPDDEVFIYKNEYDYLMNDVFESLKNGDEIKPHADILIANTVPLKNVTIRTKYEETDIKANVIIFDDCAERVQVRKKTDYFDNSDYYPDAINEASIFKTSNLGLACGYVEILGLSNKNKKYCNITIDEPISLIREVLNSKDNDYLEYGPENVLYTHQDLDLRSEAKDKKPLLNYNYGLSELNSIYNHILSVWYLVQIAMLHPVINKVVSKSKNKMRSEPDFNSSETVRKRKVKRIRQHYISIYNIEKTLEEVAEEHHINRKTMIWYVAGYHRHNKDGTVVFVQPHWKGPLRDIQEAQNQRERKLIN